MQRLTDFPAVDKDALIGACVRLPIPIELPRLQAEIAALPAELWGSRGGRVGVHTPTQGIFLRGYAPAEGDKPIEDRPALDLLPYVRELIETRIPAPPMRCLLAKLLPGAVIAPHVDRLDYFSRTLRLHFPIVTDPSVTMMARGLAFHMRAGEAWALNNSNLHAVINDWDQPRLHLICDFLPTPELQQLIRAGERGLGRQRPELIQRLAEASLPPSAPMPG